MFCWCCNGTYSKTGFDWHKYLCPRLDYSIPVMVALTFGVMIFLPIIVLVLAIAGAIYASVLSKKEEA